MRSASLSSVEIQDSFWAPKLDVYRENHPALVYLCNGNCVRLRKAAGQPVEGELNGTWGEANLYKFMRNGCMRPSENATPFWKSGIDGSSTFWPYGQQPDGYLHVYVTNNKNSLGPGFSDGSHDGYVLGHMIEAALESKRRPANQSSWISPAGPPTRPMTLFLGPNGQPASVVTPSWRWLWLSSIGRRGAALP